MNLASIVLDGVAGGFDPSARDRSLALSRVLSEQGVEPGARVALWLADRDLALAFLGVACRGALAVPLALRLGARALAHHLRAAGATILVTRASQRALAREALALAPVCRALVELDDVVPDPLIAVEPVDVDHAAAALLWFAPSEPEHLRGVARDHRALRVAITAIAQGLRVGPGEVVRVTPMQEEGSLLVSLAALLAGARLADPSEPDETRLRIVRVPAALAAAAALPSGELAPAEDLLRPQEISRVAATERSALEVLDATLPALPSGSPWLVRAASRDLDYPTGCGRGASIALEAGLKPMLRELIAVPDLEDARARFESVGLHVEVSPLVFGPTADGWLGRPASREETRRSPAEDRRPLYVGPDRDLLTRAVRAEVSRTLDGARELGLLLGYPRCCVEAFVEHATDRRAHRLWARALERTASGRLDARLNVLDHAIFSYVSWFPCRFDCDASLRLADALAAIVEVRHPGFVSLIDRVLQAPRLVLAPELQLTVEGATEGGLVRVRSLRATATDRDPRVRVDARETELAARALAFLDGAQTLAVRDGALRVDGASRPLPLEPPLPLLFPFAPPRAI